MIHRHPLCVRRTRGQASARLSLEPTLYNVLHFLCRASQGPAQDQRVTEARRQFIVAVGNRTAMLPEGTSIHQTCLPGEILLLILSKLDFETRFSTEAFRQCVRAVSFSGPRNLFDGRRRQVLPRVCKQWKFILAGPSPVWQNIQLSAGIDDRYHKVR